MRESDAKMTHNEFTHKVVGFNRTRSSIEVKRQESATDIGSNSIDPDAKMTHNEFTHKVVGFRAYPKIILRYTIMQQARCTSPR
jgi:hypothetical protein